MSFLNDKDVPTPYLYGDILRCYNCPDGTLVWEKSGNVCSVCNEVCCEYCCDAGFFDDNDEFICEFCVAEMKQ